jgi:hypothetical protein
LILQKGSAAPGREYDVKIDLGKRLGHRPPRCKTLSGFQNMKNRFPGWRFAYPGLWSLTPSE